MKELAEILVCVIVTAAILAFYFSGSLLARYDCSTGIAAACAEVSAKYAPKAKP